jgi:hypothetical protein
MLRSVEEKGRDIWKIWGGDRYKVDGVSGSFSHNLGIHGELVVNCDGDKCGDPIHIESAET